MSTHSPGLGGDKRPPVKRSFRQRLTGVPQREEDNEGNLLASKTECMKTVKELNRETARYCSLSLALGGSHDCELLREELKRIRKRAYELALLNKAKLFPHITKSMHKEKDAPDEFEKLWNTFSASLELLHLHLVKTLQLQKTFPLHLGFSSTLLLINTGIVDPWGNYKCGSLISIHHGEASESRKSQEMEEWKVLERDILEMSKTMEEMSQRVDIHPWQAEPELNPAVTKSMKSLATEVSSSHHIVPVHDGERQRRRKCICLASIVLVSLVVFATVLGVCFKLLT